MKQKIRKETEDTRETENTDEEIKDTKRTAADTRI